jgi:hypothetical protein
MSTHIRKTTLPFDLYNGTPNAPTVTPTGGAAGSYSYKIVAITAGGGHSAASSAASISNGPTTLDASHFNTIDPTALSNPGAASYDVYRTAGGATQGKIGNIPNDGVTTLQDKALVANGATAPATNTTGLGAAFQVNHFAHSTIWLHGSFSGSVKFQLSTDNGATWSDEGSALTGAGTVDVVRLADLMRAVMTAYSSGTITLDVRGLDRN